MADVGDEVGEGIKRGMNRVLSEILREWLRKHMGKRPEPGQEHCTAPLDDPELTRAVTEALGAANIPYEVKRQSLTVDGSYAMIPCQERKITFCVQEEGPAWLIWAVAGGGAVVLLGGAALLLRRKHKKQRAQVQKAQTPDQTPVGK